MPPYLRLPETGAITKRFWGLKPRNPTCGLVGWERGTLVFAWGNLIASAGILIVILLTFLLHLLLTETSTKEALKRLPELPKSDRDKIDNMYHNREVAFSLSVLFFGFLFYSIWFFLSWKLKKYAVERDLPKLRKYYVSILVLMAVDLGVLFYFLLFRQLGSVWSIFLFDIPVGILEFMGLLFTHGYIASLSTSDVEGDQPEDVNRVELDYP